VPHHCEPRLTVKPCELLSLGNFDDIVHKEMGQKKKCQEVNLCSTISDRLNLKKYPIIAFLLSSASSTYYTSSSTRILAYHASVQQDRLKVRIFVRHLARTVDVRLPHDTIPCPHRHNTNTEQTWRAAHIHVTSGTRTAVQILKYSEVFHSVHYHIMKHPLIIPPKYTMFIY
jgi:hypothetical protein